MAHSCNLEKLFNVRVQILQELKQPAETLLLFKNNSIALVSKNPSLYNENKTGGMDVEIFQFKSDGKVLKHIYQSEASREFASLIQANNLKNHSIIITESKIYNLYNEQINIQSECQNSVVSLGQKHGSKNIYGNDNIKTYLTEQQILNSIVNYAGNFSNIVDKVSLFVSNNDKRSITDKITAELKGRPPYVKNIDLKIVQSAAHLSTIEMPLSSFKIANISKDSNALHYLSKFKVSKSPKLFTQRPKYTFGMQLENTTPKLHLAAQFPIKDQYNFHLRGTQDEKLFISQIYLSNSRLINNKNYFVTYFGKMDSDNVGLLLTNQNFNLHKESVLSISGFSNLSRSCDLCIFNAIHIGYEKKIPRLNIRVAGNYETQTLKNNIRHVAQITLKKEFKSKKSILINVRNDYSNNFSPEVDIVFEFPLGISTSKSDTSISGILEYSSNIRNQITRWTQNQNDFIFHNTPNYIQKNWKKYISFN